MQRKTERCERFSSWKNRENAWKQIQFRAEKMGMERLYRQVKDVDLFAVEAKYHPSCLKAFRTSFANHERKVSNLHKPQDTKQILEFIAHEKAFSFVLEHVKTRVVQQKGIAKLVNLRTLYVDELKRNNYRNDEFRAEKLLKRLQSNPVSEDFLFTKVDPGRQGAVTFWLLCSKKCH